MLTENFETFSTQSLIKRRIFSNVALIMVWIGAAIAIGAVVYRFLTNGEFPSLTLIVSVLALIVSVPVYRERMLISKILNRRGQVG